jgi:hypothetical protein
MLGEKNTFSAIGSYNYRAYGSLDLTVPGVSGTKKNRKGNPVGTGTAPDYATRSTSVMANFTRELTPHLDLELGGDFIYYNSDFSAQAYNTQRFSLTLSWHLN